jgi:hypothetical protein
LLFIILFITYGELLFKERQKHKRDQGEGALDHKSISKIVAETSCHSRKAT